MSNYKQFNPYEVALAQSVNDNFNIVKQGLTNTCASKDIDTATMSGKINMNNHIITGLPEKLDSSSAVILKQLPNYYTTINLQLNPASFDCGDYKTIVVAVNQNASQSNPFIFNINIDPNKPRYVYTIITLGIDSTKPFYFQLSNTNTTPAINSITYAINANSSNSFVFTNGAFYKYNYSYNLNTSPSNNNIRKVFQNLTNYANVPAVTFNAGPIPLANLISLEVNIYNLAINNPDANSIYFLTFSNNSTTLTNNSSYSTITVGNKTPGIQALNFSSLNSNSNLLGNIWSIGGNFGTMSSTYFNYLNNSVNFAGYGINVGTNSKVIFNSYGGQMAFPATSTNILTIKVIKKPWVANDTSNYVLNASASSETISNMQTSFTIIYQSTL